MNQESDCALKVVSKDAYRASLEKTFSNLKLKRLWLVSLVMVLILFFAGKYFQGEKISIILSIINYFLIIIVGFYLSIIMKKVDILFELYKSE